MRCVPVPVSRWDWSRTSFSFLYYLKDGAMELDAKGPTAVDRERMSTIRSWSILSFKAWDKFSLFMDMDAPSKTDFPEAPHTWAESHHSKHVIQGCREIWSRTRKWTWISKTKASPSRRSLQTLFLGRKVGSNIDFCEHLSNSLTTERQNRTLLIHSSYLGI